MWDRGGYARYLTSIVALPAETQQHRVIFIDNFTTNTCVG